MSETKYLRRSAFITVLALPRIGTIALFTNTIKTIYLREIPTSKRCLQNGCVAPLAEFYMNQYKFILKKFYKTRKAPCVLMALQRNFAVSPICAPVSLGEQPIHLLIHVKITYNKLYWRIKPKRHECKREVPCEALYLFTHNI